jgi:hypothetical protein
MVDFGMDLQSCITMFEKPLGNSSTGNTAPSRIYFGGLVVLYVLFYLAKFRVPRNNCFDRTRKPTLRRHPGYTGGRVPVPEGLGSNPGGEAEGQPSRQIAQLCQGHHQGRQERTLCHRSDS